MSDPALRSRPIRVALVNDYEIVVRGLNAVLAPFADRLHIVELDSRLPPSQPVDVALYDAFSMEGTRSPAIDDLIGHPNIRRLAIYTWNLMPEVVAEAREHGVLGVLSKTLEPEALVEAIERIHAGEVVASPDPGPDIDITTGEWPGHAEGLTARESEIVCLIVQGLSNNEIAERTYLSINSVKSYIRTAYRTMGVTTRSQALLWGLDHGMRPKPTRTPDPNR